MEIGQYPKRVTHPRVTHPCELFDTESKNDLAQGDKCWALSSPPAPQAPVRYTCVQDLSEASLGSLLYRGLHSMPIGSTMQGAAETSPYKLLNLHPTAWAASEVAVYRGEVATTARPDHVPIALTELRSSLSIPPLTRRQHRRISSFDDPATPRPYPPLAEDPDQHSAPHRQDNFPPKVATGPPRPTDRRASKRCLSGAYRGGRTEDRQSRTAGRRQPRRVHVGCARSFARGRAARF